MRVITGTARRKDLKTLPGLDVRPTAGSIKESMFSTIQFEISGKNVLDLFAGSGQLGIEALSRGASNAVFVDNYRPSIEIIKKNLEITGLTGVGKVLQLTNSVFLRTTKEIFDIAFLDPPYEHDLIQKSLPALAEKMSENGIIVCEHEYKCKVPQCVADFSIYRQYKYGKTGVTIYKKMNNMQEDIAPIDEQIATE